MKTMFRIKLRIASRMCLAAGLLGMLAFHAGGAEKPSENKKDPSAAESFAALHRVILPQQAEHHWALFPWLTSITQARHQAAVTNKPLLIFVDTGAGFADAMGMC
jgi:hypothetical protein